MSRPKGVPPDRQPVQQVLDWLCKLAPSACDAGQAARELRLDEELAGRVLVGLGREGFAVREDGECFRAADEDDPW